MKVKRTLIIGKPATSKTTFLIQLYSLMRSGNGRIQLNGLPESIKPIEDDYNRLRKGEQTQTTPAEKNIDLILKIKVAGEDCQLICPDYGGEQINGLISNRQIKEGWVKLVKDSDDWLLFIKLDDLTSMHDITTKPASEGLSDNKSDKGDEIKYGLSEAPEMVELLQMLLYFKKIGYQIPINTIDLKIVITRWDQLIIGQELPKDLLRSKLPLLYQFLKSNWNTKNLSVWGLSAQGFDISIPENKEKYLEEGNEKWAFIIRPDGERSNDLTELLINTNN